MGACFSTAGNVGCTGVVSCNTMIRNDDGNHAVAESLKAARSDLRHEWIW
jgi:hypothetical protein